MAEEQATETTEVTAEVTTEETSATDTQESPKTNLGNVPDDKPAAFSDDWRTVMSGEDEKLGTLLGRYSSPSEVARALAEAQTKIRSGQKREPLAEDATDEQVAEYRKANGIPETPDGYLEKVPDGLVIGEEDKQQIGSFIEAMHGRNAQPEMVHEALKWYNDLKEQAGTAQAEFDRENGKATEDALRDEWGGDFRANQTSIANLFADAPDIGEMSFRDAYAEARLPDGRRLGDVVEVNRYFARLAREINPAGVVAPSDGVGQIESIEAEIKGIESKMGTRAYTQDEAMQARYRQLIDARGKLKGRSQAA